MDSKIDVDAIKRDFFDASMGSQVGLDSNENPVLMWVLKPESVKLILDAAKYHQDHECKEGVHMGLYVLYTLAAQLTHIFPYLPDSIKTWEPFKH